ncbi:hypothetical protein HUG20_10890 [Salicibibacter cibi]|uniref:Uncharacterized protein n=1 Tax=Salicibibacter cibi TaxID=2743001 RepID=A0A7T7CDX8_9BACI|nr:hypothetical protein [Salicibibacter cibi]QQK78464.1 hypothetical protein HUG20_10890 [Salicibibacter cibi]
MENFQLENKDSIETKACNAIRKAILRGIFRPEKNWFRNNWRDNWGSAECRYERL